ncbi:uncharacterized protein EV422DRAFT_520262 [Fimicolochytrium jonesii]|uniref:uncharacterized protein n=1 Tax=Fimicolochytrium jonesii TaxID=1396493 RepID=UPI0022FDEC02|nr:uncharacterized protein EV422DRAFT_520262 [Fimicolochytrium jonesii]KAI8824484.1 hypothetical protein EV422DRAFT_520262 [Fimicolochytrium jonesii]
MTSHQAAITELLQALGPKITLDAKSLTRHSKDNSYHTPYPPLAIAHPESEADISTILSICNTHRLPVVPYAAGSSLEGHVIPEKGVKPVIIDISKMDSVIAVHKDDLAVTVEPGVGWMELNAELRDLGLFFPPDPGAAACIGGMCGTNCSGTLAWKYGTMKDNVLGLRVVLADGRVITTRKRVTKSSAGYDLTRLLVGSEGTLGVVSRAILRLRRIPRCTSVAMVQFPTLDLACVYVQKLVLEGPPTLNRIELMDALCIRSVNIANDEAWPEVTTLLLEFAGPTMEQLANDSRQCETLSSTHGVSAYRFGGYSARESEKLWSIRKKAFFASKALRPDLPNCAILTTDVAVPISQLQTMLHHTHALIAQYGLTSPIVAHAGDGNFHCFVLFDPSNHEESGRVEGFRDGLIKKALELDGTCTGEHGIGKGKREALVMELGEDAVEVMRSIKRALDPHGIMNPGKVFRLEEGCKAKL